ncbi:stalk domain-containing protein [Fictibacillus arsenicus]|uniref:YkuD domain-containing protein n=1 Tax=Fictibacillus arsenicus TaxID=255247 RepID=A0A1V3GC61_9BACL|nr:stalk domain-containing protein [Fictibacillus arsenicus]OOE14434.1 hypothetical protein UN64_04370 [Fictibacillus arsenicus]
MKRLAIWCFALFVFGSMNLKPVSAADYREKLISNHFFNESQLIIVEANGWDTKYAKLSTYHKVKGVWKKALSDMPAVIGYNGFAEVMKEGGGSSPTGIYQLGTGFGTVGKPSGSNYPFRTVTRYDYWVDDISSRDYNKWIYYTGNPYSRWKTFERMNHPLYRYGVVIKYNDNPIISGKGSAIFLHMWKSSSSATAGCVAVSETNMVNLLRWLNQSQKPHIVMGPTSKINSYLNSRKEQLHEVGVMVNGKKLELDQPAVNIDSRTLAPIRGIAESLGASVKWDTTTETVRAELNGTTVELKYLSNIAKVNGKSITLDTAPLNINNRIVVPVRFFSEAFGAEVTWDSVNDLVKINK